MARGGVVARGPQERAHGGEAATASALESVAAQALRRDLGEAGAVELIAFLEGALTVWLLDPETTDLRAMYERYLSR